MKGLGRPRRAHQESHWLEKHVRTFCLRHESIRGVVWGKGEEGRRDSEVISWDVLLSSTHRTTHWLNLPGPQSSRKPDWPKLMELGSGNGEWVQFGYRIFSQGDSKKWLHDIVTIYITVRVNSKMMNFVIWISLQFKKKKRIITSKKLDTSYKPSLGQAAWKPCLPCKLYKGVQRQRGLTGWLERGEKETKPKAVAQV